VAGSKRDMRAIEDLRKILRNPDGILDVVSASVAEESINLIKDGFRKETDPYGRRWAPKRFPDGRKALSGRTSRLKGGWHITRQTRDKIVIAASVDYADYHQHGTGIHGPRRQRIFPTEKQALRFPGPGGKPVFAKSVEGVQQRMMVPDEIKGLPPRWERRLNEAATDALAGILGGDGRRVSGLRKRLGINALVGFKVA
jgi:phage gpG-like protein